MNHMGKIQKRDGYRPPLYDPSFERDACGTGFIAQISGEPTHDLVVKAVEAVINLTHRGAVSADAKTGDGAGILTQLPTKLILREIQSLGVSISSDEELAVGMFFFPPGSNINNATPVIQEELESIGLNFLTWRDVPVNSSVLGQQALDTMPQIKQAIIAAPVSLTIEEFERKLYVTRRNIEKKVSLIEGFATFHIASLSSKTVVYKGLLVAPQLSTFYLDLADNDFESAIAVFHQRYSTNTLPNWALAQPFRFLGHNGEINTLQGNRNWLRARGGDLNAPVWSKSDLQSVIPITDTQVSDSGSLDHALELLNRSGRDILHSMIMLIPEAWENMPNMDPDLRAFYEYHALLTEPWDGPAAVAFSDGDLAGAILDRNGLRPARYHVTDDGFVIMASEVGVLRGIEESTIIEKGRLAPGEMIAVDTVNNKILKNSEIKTKLISGSTYSELRDKSLVTLKSSNKEQILNKPVLDHFSLLRRQKFFGYTAEETLMVIKPMVQEGKDATYSMGDDTPLAVLSQLAPPIYNYFKQGFAQVTNPAIDPIREAVVMSSNVYLGKRSSLIGDPSPDQRLLALEGPIILNEELDQIRNIDENRLRSVTLPTVFPVSGGRAALEKSLDDLCDQAESAVDDGNTIIILSDRGVDEKNAPIPMLLAVGAVHQELIKRGKRMKASIICDSGEPRDVHHYASLIGYGASAVNPYLVWDILRNLSEKGELKDLDDEDYPLLKYRIAANNGILKIMSKMGISTVTSYHGSQIFECLGLSQQVIDKCFTATLSRLGGIGFEEIADDVLKRHTSAVEEEITEKSKLVDHGFIRFRKAGEFHANNPIVVRTLHKAVRSGDYEEYVPYRDAMNNRPISSVRDILQFRRDKDPIPLDQVEPLEEIWKHFTTGAMSLGALSPIAHETLAAGMNAIGAASDTGEGGEDPKRFRGLMNGINANSKIKQIASGRFGVTPEYLSMAEEIEIKVAQGSKPGEGGQLPGHKVIEYIAYIRHTQPGITLISPPPHHDIYSIEDLAQLIYDLKMINPEAQVTVKLVSGVGVGTIAAGVAKGYADKIHISGSDGGTGASPLSSIKNAGSSWELGLAETEQVLVMNDLRGRVKLRTDGGIRTGKDVVMATMFGADEIGFGTVALVAMGCEMARQCHLNSCPVGIATQRDDLIEKFTGDVDSVVNYFTFVATEVREILASLGYKSLKEVIGHPEYLEPRSDLDNEERAMALDVRPLLGLPDPEFKKPIKNMQDRNDRQDDYKLDDTIMADIGGLIEPDTQYSGSYKINNSHRTVGAKISGHIAKEYGLTRPGSLNIDLNFDGTAGQSFGAFLVDGVTVRLNGEANDYVGKGMGGGKIVIRPPRTQGYNSHENSIMGNTCLYGATDGLVFAAGQAGERFAIRNSGVQAVVEGLGDHGCEYMTNGVVVVLGEVGRNFGAGMSGGVAFIYDKDEKFAAMYNQDLLVTDTLSSANSEDEQHLLELIKQHFNHTGSEIANNIVKNWEDEKRHFLRVMPAQLREKKMTVKDILKKVEELT